jgi:cell division protein FtsW
MSEKQTRNTGSTRATASATRTTTTARRPSTASTRTTGARPYKTAATLAAPTASVAAERRTRTSVRSRVTSATGEWDYPLLAIMAIILAVGLVMVFSASYPKVGVNFFLRQVAWLGLGIVALIVMARIPYDWWQRFAIPIMIVALGLLAAVLIFGDDVNYARRTFRIGSFQPSEFAKLAVVIYVSTWVASKGKRVAELSGGLIPFGVIIGLVTSLIILEPNFSTAIVVLTIGIAIFFVGGADVKQLVVVGIIGAVMLGLLMWQSHAYSRITHWIDGLSDPTAAEENVRYALELMRQRNGLLPVQANWNNKLSVALLWSDYLFANVGADLGLIGQLVVVVLFAVFGYRCLGIALNAPDKFGALAVIGVTTWVLAQAVIHMGTSLALIPATGQTLPLMSYGGSSLVTTMAALGLVLGIGHASPEKKSVYASFAFGGRDRRSRVPDLDRGGRAGERRKTNDER